MNEHRDAIDPRSTGRRRAHPRSRVRRSRRRTRRSRRTLTARSGSPLFPVRLLDGWLRSSVAARQTAPTPAAAATGPRGCRPTTRTGCGSTRTRRRPGRGCRGGRRASHTITPAAAPMTTTRRTRAGRADRTSAPARRGRARGRSTMRCRFARSRPRPGAVDDVADGEHEPAAERVAALVHVPVPPLAQLGHVVAARSLQRGNRVGDQRRRPSSRAPRSSRARTPASRRPSASRTSAASRRSRRSSTHEGGRHGQIDDRPRRTGDRRSGRGRHHRLGRTLIVGRLAAAAVNAAGAWRAAAASPGTARRP